MISSDWAKKYLLYKEEQEMALPELKAPLLSRELAQRAVKPALLIGLNFVTVFFSQLLQECKNDKKSEIRIPPKNFGRIEFAANLSQTFINDFGKYSLFGPDMEVLKEISDWNNPFRVRQREFFDGMYLSSESLSGIVDAFEKMRNEIYFSFGQPH